VRNPKAAGKSGTAIETEDVGASSNGGNALSGTERVIMRDILPKPDG